MMMDKATRLQRSKEGRERARRKREEGEKNLAHWLAGSVPLQVNRVKSDAERQRKHRARFYEIGPLPTVADPARRASCERDLLRFILTYCMDLFDHTPAPKIIDGIIKPVESAVLFGGKELPVFPRGTGKTTIIKAALRWAFAYGHKRFVVLIGATRDLAIAIFDEVVDSLSGSDSENFVADFPALAIPISALGGNKKAAPNQTVNGAKTRMVFKETRFQLPSVVGEDGKLVEPSAGAVFVACSMGGAIKGLVKKKERPDMFFLDDPQTESMAKSPLQTRDADKFIIGSVLGLSGHTREKTALMAITPIRIGDLACRFMDRQLHGDWHVSRTSFVEGWTDEMEKLIPAYTEAYNEDVAIGDRKMEISRQFYLDHRESFAGCSVVDPNNFTAKEIDAIHHLLNLRVEFKEEFAAEYMLDVTAESAGEVLTPETVEQNVNNYPRFALPPGTYQAVAFVDVNVSADAGLRYGIMAFGPKRVAAIVDYGRYPVAGERLYPVNCDPLMREAAIIDGIKKVIGALKRAPLYCYDGGTSVKLRAIAVDGGYEMDIVDKTLKWIGQNVNMGGTHLYYTRGFDWSHYNDNVEGVQQVKDHIHSAISVSKDRKRIRSFLGVHADYWREVMQKAWIHKYPAAGSLSLFGPDAAAQRHSLFAVEVSYEHLIRVYVDNGKTKKRAWEWDNAKPGHNHSADICYNCMALAHFEGLYTALAPVAVKSEESVAVEPVQAVETPSAPVSAENRARVVPVVKRKHSLFKPCRRSGGGGHVTFR